MLVGIKSTFKSDPPPLRRTQYRLARRSFEVGVAHRRTYGLAERKVVVVVVVDCETAVDADAAAVEEETKANLEKGQRLPCNVD